MLNIGVLALQGSVVEHLRMLSAIRGVIPHEVRTAHELEKVSGLIIPGGESTTIGKLINDFDLARPIRKRAKDGMPIWGTCAGMILMAKHIVNENYTHLGLMDISVRRNAYGSQLGSFSASVVIPEVSGEEIPLVFIRAPWIESIYGDAEVLAMVGERIAAARQGNMLVTSFHPELTENAAFHRFFVESVKKFIHK